MHLHAVAAKAWAAENVIGVLSGHPKGIRRESQEDPETPMHTHLAPSEVADERGG